MSSSAARRSIAADALCIPVKGKTVILIDDGLATGSTMRAAVAALRQHEPAQIVVAVPVGASSTCAEFEGIADRCVCAIAPEHFRSVGLWYEDFAQTGDDEVCDLLARACLRRDQCQHDQAESRANGTRSKPTSAGANRARRATKSQSTPVAERCAERLRLPHRCSRGHPVRTRQRQRAAEPAEPVRRAGACKTPAWQRC